MGKVYAVSDIHGEYDLFSQIKCHLGQDDICYVLGDATDRGADGIKILQEIIRDKRFIFLRGNHEQMLMDSWSEQLMGIVSELTMLFCNGGIKTWEDFLALTQEEQCEIYSFLVHSKKMAQYKNVFLTHAGYDFRLSPHLQDLIWGRGHIECDPGIAPNDIIQVHGHTPVQTFRGYDKSEVYQYKPSKICIDIGATFTGKIALLDLDTFETFYFERR